MSLTLSVHTYYTKHLSPLLPLQLQEWRSHQGGGPRSLLWLCFVGSERACNDFISCEDVRADFRRNLTDYWTAPVPAMMATLVGVM